MTFESQNKKLADHLMSGKGISSMLAFKMFGITSLHRRLADLRKAGFPINFGEWAEYAGKRFKVYNKIAKHEKITRSRVYEG